MRAHVCETDRTPLDLSMSCKGRYTTPGAQISLYKWSFLSAHLSRAPVANRPSSFEAMFHRRCLPMPEEFIKSTMESSCHSSGACDISRPQQAYDFWEFRTTTLRTAACQRSLRAHSQSHSSFDRAVHLLARMASGFRCISVPRSG